MMGKTAFRKKILSWYENNKRQLPWRKTTDPYKILVSEVMLQQTQVDRVIPYYERWIEELPDFDALNKASTRKVLSLWSGLGYNNRALRLKRLASIVVKEGFPETQERLLALPGVGPYTANAILAFAFNKDVAVIDTNIRRILIHEFGLDEDISREELEELAFEVLPKGRARTWYNALMDYGAVHLTARKTGISPQSTQGTFEGSTRQVRGQLLKHLIKEQTLQYSVAKDKFSHEEFEKIVEKMEKEGLIALKEDSITLPDTQH